MGTVLYSFGSCLFAFNHLKVAFSPMSTPFPSAPGNVRKSKHSQLRNLSFAVFALLGKISSILLVLSTNRVSIVVVYNHTRKVLNVTELLGSQIADIAVSTSAS